ncbi:MAG: MATE family efflux transporter [Candidatus Gracilibacteria bacterium]|nr:MATE family efflux transporter [Candidatus Gracilibacteria bacterium]MDD3120139.1 MATE family efflux transporter [Candidatus Gracilibacteria bacterium]
MTIENKNIKIALEGPIIKSIFTLAIPILLANLLQSAYQLIDAFWVGRLGDYAIAAVSVSFPITFFMISLGTGFSIAGSTLIAQYVGAKNRKMVNHVAAQTLFMMTVVSIVLGTIGYILSPSLLSLMGVSPEVFSNALTFMRVSFVGLAFVFGFSIFQSIMRGIGQVKMPMYIVFGTVCLNFILDPFFIYGYGIVPTMGVAGAAMATFFTQGIAAIIGFVILLRGNYGIHLKLSDFKPDFIYIKKAFFLGLPSSIEMSVRSLGMIVMTFLITSFGTTAIASFGAGSNISQIVIILGMGLSMSTSILVGQNIGANNIKRAKDIAKISALISFASLTTVGILVFFTAPLLVSFFVPNDINVINGGAIFIRTIAFSFGFIGLQFAIMGVFRASGNMVTTMVISLVSQWVLQLPLAYFLSKHTPLGVQGLWYAFPISNVLIALISVFRFMKGTWQKTKLTKEYEMIEKISEEANIEGVMK